jgi:hypothetical protein
MLDQNGDLPPFEILPLNLVSWTSMVLELYKLIGTTEVAALFAR